MKDLGPLNFFGYFFTRTYCIFLSQKKYALEIIDRAYMSSCMHSSTPVDTKSKLSTCFGNQYDDPIEYYFLVRTLQYLIFTRPDFAM